MQETPSAPDLTATERRLWNAFPTGAWVDLTPDDPAESAPEHDLAGTDPPVGSGSRAHSTPGLRAPEDDVAWGPERTVRAEVIAHLLLGARSAEPGHVASVRLRGARVTGGLTLSSGSTGCELWLEGCLLDEPPDLAEFSSRTLRITDSRLPGFRGSGLKVDGHLSLSGSVVEGEVRLARAQLSGGLRLNRTTIRNPDGWAFSSGALSVGAGMYAQGAEFDGGMRLAGARMTAGLFLQGATLRKPGGEALSAPNLSVEDAMMCSDGFTAEGTVSLRGARVNGMLSFRGAVLRGGPDVPALNANHIEARELVLVPSEPIRGMVNLTYSRIGVILDDTPAVWPDELRLNGLVYDSLRGFPAHRRLDWVARDPRGFRPQPYEQLAAWFVRDGNDALARRTQLAKLRARRATERLDRRIWGHLLDATVGYGYRPWLAALWFGLLLAVGTTVFSLVPPPPLKAAEAPHFNAFAYSLDLLVPLNAFGQRGAFNPSGWTQWLSYTLVGSGWLLTTALFAGITRTLRIH